MAIDNYQWAIEAVQELLKNTLERHAELVEASLLHK